MIIGSKDSGDHGTMGIKRMMGVKEHGAWFGVSMGAFRVVVLRGMGKVKV